MNTPPTPADVIAAARSLMGVPFRHQGRGIEEGGFDCAGLLVHVKHTLGLAPFDIADYGRKPKPAEMGALLERELVRSVAIEAGGAAWLRYPDPQHLAVVGRLDDGSLSLIHSAMVWGKVVEHRIDAGWLRRIVATYRFPGVAYPEAG